MNSRFSGLIAFFGITLLNPVNIAEAKSGKAAVYVGYHPDRGERAFDISVRHDTAGALLTYLAPDGTEFIDSGLDRDVVADLTADELTSRFAGFWTIIVEDVTTTPSKIEEHGFAIRDYGLNSLPPVPTLISPPDGARLAMQFQMSHTGFESHFLIPGVFGGWSTQSFWSVDGIVGLPLPAAAIGHSGTSATTSLGATFPRTGAPLWQLDLQLRKTSYSPPHHWLVGVPEPPSAALASFALLSLAALRRRK